MKYDWDWVSLVTMCVTVTVALNGYIRNPTFINVGRLKELHETVELLKTRCEVLESERDEARKRHGSCENQLAQMRREIQWMRDNMVLKPTT